MPSFPRIDSPCPLSAEEQGAIDGHCDRCDKHVHALNDMNEAERRALLANAAGPICVSYRKPVPRRVGRIGVAIAATLITTTAYAAGEPAPPPAGQPTVAAALQGVEELDSELDFVLITGGVNDPQDALAAEDTSVPELPIRTVDAALTEIDGGTALDGMETVIVGGIQKPGQAEWSDDDASLPALPMIAAHETESPAPGGASDGSH